MSNPTPDDFNPGAYDQPAGGPTPSGPPPFQAPGHQPAYTPGAPPPGVWSGPRPRGPIGEARPVALTILLTIVTCGVWMILWAYWNHEEMQRYRGEGLGGVVGALLTWLAYPVTMFTIPMEIEAMYREEGQEPPVSTLLGLWFILPIIGNVVWYLQVQKALNEFWIAHGAPPPS